MERETAPGDLVDDGDRRVALDPAQVQHWSYARHDLHVTVDLEHARRPGDGIEPHQEASAQSRAHRARLLAGKPHGIGTGHHRPRRSRRREINDIDDAPGHGVDDGHTSVAIDGDRHPYQSDGGRYGLRMTGEFDGLNLD